MGKKKIVDMVTVSIEDKLESNGVLRNVAVNDAWKRLRQNIDVKSWKMAEGVLQELSNCLQKIYMLNAMTGLFAKLRQAFQNPELTAEESEYLAKETPRDAANKVAVSEKPKPDATRKADTDGEGAVKTREELHGLRSTLQQIKSSLESTGAVPDQLDTPSDVSEDVTECYQNILLICDRCVKCNRDLEHTKKRLENSETRNKELEKLVDERLEKVDKLTAAVDTLEKKHNSMKEEKQETFKDQMKYKSLERQVELKSTELTKAREENKDLKDRLKAIQSSKNKDSSDLLNPFPPIKLAEKFRELYNKEWKDAFEYYRTSGKLTDADAAKRLMDMLQDCFTFCSDTSASHLQKLASELVSPGDLTGSTRGLSLLEEAEIKQIQSLRKQTCKSSCEIAKSTFVMLLESGNEEKYSFQEITDTMAYIEKCVEICWFLVLQTPPLYIGFTKLSAPNNDIDKGKYEVVGKGSKVDYVTWPPLQAWKDGDILLKGFVQAK